MAQTPPSPVRVVTLPEALQYAADHYPTLKAAVAQVQASASGVDVAKAAVLPRLEGLWQTNRATVNNVTGLLLPQSVVPGISGPPLPSVSASSAWASAVGAFFSWEIVDFGLRGAAIGSAEASVTRARAEEALTRLDVQAAVAAAYLAVVQAEQALVAARADVERRTVLARVARTLADNELRPGAEASRADAERATAQTRAILAGQALTLAQIALGRLLGTDQGPVGASAIGVTVSAPAAATSAAAVSAHPLAQARLASIDFSRSQETVLAHTNRPRVFAQSALFSRGSGARYNGALDGGASGLAPDHANWAAGVQVVFPNLFEAPALRARRTAAAATTRAESARYDEARLLLTSQQRAAAALVDAARAVLANTPAQLDAARLTESQAQARYQAGLASIVEVAEAQQLLAQAEFQSATAHVDLWRALVVQATAHGSLAPIVDLLSTSGGGGR